MVRVAPHVGPGRWTQPRGRKSPAAPSIETTRTLPNVDRERLDELMGIALDEAGAAGVHDDVPIGAVVARVADGEIVARRHNEREVDGDPTAHAEILAARDAARAAGSWRLDGHALVVTLEPCPMCSGVVVAARFDLVAFGARDPKAGALGSLYNLAADPRLNHESTVVEGVRAGECTALLTAFFAARRG